MLINAVNLSTPRDMTEHKTKFAYQIKMNITNRLYTVGVYIVQLYLHLLLDSLKSLSIHFYKLIHPNDAILYPVA